MATRVMRFAVAAFAALAATAAGLASAQERKVAINFGLTYIPVGNSPVFTVPKSMGFWKEEGLDVEVQLANGTGTALQQLIAGFFHSVVSEAGTPGLDEDELTERVQAKLATAAL